MLNSTHFALSGVQTEGQVLPFNKQKSDLTADITIFSSIAILTESGTVNSDSDQASDWAHSQHALNCLCLHFDALYS